MVLLGIWGIPKLFGIPPPVWAEFSVSLLAMFIYFRLSYRYEDEIAAPSWLRPLFWSEAAQVFIMFLSGLYAMQAYLLAQNLIFASQILFMITLSSEAILQRVRRPRINQASDDLPKWMTAGRDIRKEDSILYRGLMYFMGRRASWRKFGK